MSIVAIFLSAASILAIFYVGFLIGRIEDPAVCHVQESVKNSIASNIDVLTGTDAPCPPGFILRTDSESASDNIMVNDANSQSLKPADRENFEELLDSFEEDCKFGDVKKYYLHKRVGLIQDEIFDFVKHAAQPTKGDIIVNAIENSEKLDPMSGCEEMYLTRTGARESKSPKCVAIVRLEDKSMVSPYYTNHRMGTVATFLDQYQTDYSKDVRDENDLLRPLVKQMEKPIQQVRDLLGDPLEEGETGKRKTAVVMVANEGVIDLVMNLLCSCRAARIDTSNYLIFVGSEEDVTIINNMGVHAVFNPILGSMPKNAAGYYGDRTFSRMMWLKVSSVYVASKAGYNVLFQDCDLVWFQDPIPYLQTFDDESDIIFMDDGGRTPRFTPLYVNSGFYYQKYNSRVMYLMEKMLKSVSEISTTHSHQATLIRHIVESHDVVGLHIRMVDQKLFPSGYMYHHQKKYIEHLIAYEELPYVFHMCWTSNKDDKIAYFKNIGMWYLPAETATVVGGTDSRKNREVAANNVCATNVAMKKYVDLDPKNSLLDKCCMPASYFENKPKT